MTVITAKGTPQDRAGSGWYEILPPPGPAVQLEEARTADWAVVGAGFAGLTAAQRLTELCPGARVVVLDAQRIGFGAAGRNSGFMIDLPHVLKSDNYAGGLEADRKQIAMNRAAISYAAEIVERYGLQAHFNRCGKYHGAAGRRGLAALEAFEGHLAKLQEPFESLDAADMKAVTGTDFYRRGTFTPGAPLIQPAGYVRGLAEGLRNRISLFENSPVVRIDTGAPFVLHTPKGRVEADKVILTVNGHLESFGFFTHRLLHILLFASMTRTLSPAEEARLGGAPAWGMIPADPMGTTVRRLNEGRIVIRNGIAFDPKLRGAAEEIEKAGRRHDESFRARFPMLGDVEMEYRWSGHLCLSWNSVPAFGELEEGLFAACCQNGLGVCKGTLHGKLIAEMACGQPSAYLDELLASAEPKRLPPEPFNSLGVNLSLWWRQRRAGEEI
jgi:glycine/D-amino acid oxidase-like deaminating enzyme